MLSAEKVLGELKARDVELLSASKEGWLDEAPAAYKDVDEVVRVSAEAGLGRIVARLSLSVLLRDNCSNLIIFNSLFSYGENCSDLLC
jgi:RNA-splicing ligase RtcB